MRALTQNQSLKLLFANLFLSEDNEYRVWFFKKKYHATVPRSFPVGIPIVRTYARSARNDDRPLSYSIVSVNNRSSNLRYNPFKINYAGVVVI